MRRVALDYGNSTIEVHVDHRSTVVELPPATEAPLLEGLLEDALDEPIASPRLERLGAGVRNVLVIVSDGTRDEPRLEMLEAVRRRLPAGARVRVAIANGTHAPADPAPLTLPRWAQPAINHDSRDPSNIVHIGTTSRGTPLEVNRVLLDSELVVATGAVRPHYFAGFGGGVKAIFPGLGQNDAIRTNHRLKSSPGAVAGKVENNPCRDDLEEVIGHLEMPLFLLNVVPDVHGRQQSAVAGDVVEAHRQAAVRSRALHAVEAPAARRLVVAHGGACSKTLYQACKMIAAVAVLAEPGALIVVAADCDGGVGSEPSVVNEAIFSLGIAPRLPEDARIVVVSERLWPLRAELFCEVARSFDGLLDEPALVVPRAAGSLLFSRAGHA